MGSLAFVAAARAVYLVAKDKDNPARMLVLPIKNNIAKVKTGLAYSVIEAENKAPVIAWESEPVDMTADDALIAPESNEQRAENDWIVDLLRDVLGNGPVPALEVIKEAAEAGIKEKLLRRVYREMGGIKPRKQSFTGPWIWELPLSKCAQGGQDSPPKIDGNLGILEQKGHLRDKEIDI
jgi:hypothetical protein